MTVADRSARYRARHPSRITARARTARATRSQRTPDEVAADRARIHPDGRKTCPGCRERLAVDAFYANRSRPDGLSVLCAPCALDDRRERTHTTP